MASLKTHTQINKYWQKLGSIVVKVLISLIKPPHIFTVLVYIGRKYINLIGKEDFGETRIQGLPQQFRSDIKKEIYET